MKNNAELFDTHTHSNLSDGANSPQEMLEAAAARGLGVFALTDHFDIHEDFPKPRSMFDGAGREESYKILSELKRNNRTSVKFLNGIEIAQAHQFREVADNWLESHDYDFVIGSVHIIRGHTDFYHMDYAANHPDKLLAQYFEELSELCLWGKFDSLAHLTYPLRYMHGRGSFDKHRAAIDELFIIMAESEIALEVNTAAGNTADSEMLFLLKRFRESGGRLLTIGSDSHSVDAIANGIGRGVKMAKDCGFAECVYYENRKPCFIKL